MPRHKKDNTFEAELKNEKVMTVQPEIDFAPIGKLALAAPQKVDRIH